MDPPGTLKMKGGLHKRVVCRWESWRETRWDAEISGQPILRNIKCRQKYEEWEGCGKGEG